MQNIELNRQFTEALEKINAGKNIFITGRAGTGKSTLLNYFCSQSEKPVVVLAPTGVAAVNVKGQTIHHFFGFGPGITLRKIKKRISEEKKKLFEKLTTIVIDEVSMVRADLLDCIDAFLRLHGPKKRQPFGGVQMVFIGDLYQLPPVVTSHERQAFSELYESPYFFSARSFDALGMDFMELEKVYRQKDDCFIKLLNAIRNKTATSQDYEKINERYDPYFEPSGKEMFISLTSTNADADVINEKEMRKLPGKETVLEGYVEGNFPDSHLPAALEMKIKKGAQIMMLNNDLLGRWVNGTVGQVTDENLNTNGEPSAIEVKLHNGSTHLVSPHTWDIYHFYLNEGAIDSKKVGSFTQFPFRIAFAVTIHKAQGKTFDKMIIDIGRGTFAHGQMYVALSRATSLNGIVLKKPVLPKHVWLDWAIVRFITKYQYAVSAKHLPTEDKVSVIENAIKNGNDLEITYLKGKDIKSRRVIRPRFVGELDYEGITFLGVTAYCLIRKEERNFNVEKILEMKVV